MECFELGEDRGGRRHCREEVKATRDAVTVPTGVAGEPGLAGGLCFNDAHFDLVQGFGVGDEVINGAKFAEFGVVGSEMGAKVSAAGDEIVVSPGQGTTGAA